MSLCNLQKLFEGGGGQDRPVGSFQLSQRPAVGAGKGGLKDKFFGPVMFRIEFESQKATFGKCEFQFGMLGGDFGFQGVFRSQLADDKDESGLRGHYGFVFQGVGKLGMLNGAESFANPKNGENRSTFLEKLPGGS